MLKSLSLTNFRNYDNYSISFDNINIFIGANGIGKTNVLEAVWMLADGKSWRTSHDIEAIKWGEDFAKIEAELSEKHLELILQRHPTSDRPQPKLFKENGVKRRLIDLLGEMPAILFSPETIQMIGGAPQLRRRFLDILLSQVDKKYAVKLLEYAKVLRSRNKLLFMISVGKGKEEELDFWDERLVLLGSDIIKQRKDVVRYFNLKLTEVYESISGKKEKLKLKYKATVEEERFEDVLVAARQREIQQSQTVHGPHRDDLEIMLDGRNIDTFGSRGEYRSAVLALKVLELRYMESQIETKPILLLDDIFSELDQDRRMHLAKIVEGQQTIITTTDLDHIQEELRKKAKIIELDR